MELHKLAFERTKCILTCNCICIYQVAWDRRQRRDLFGLRVKFPLALLYATHDEGFTLSLFTAESQARKQYKNQLF